MRASLRVVVIAAALAGCQKTKPSERIQADEPGSASASSPQAPADCAAVATRVAVVAKRDPTGSRVTADLVAAVIASCDEDGWPDDAKRCLGSAAVVDEAGMNRCLGAMPHDPQEKLAARVEAVIGRAVDRPMAKAARVPPKSE